MRLAPSRWGMAPGSTLTGCLAMVQRPTSVLCFMNKSSISVRKFYKEMLASEPQKSFTSCGCYSGPVVGSVGSVEDKNANSGEEVNCESVQRYIFSQSLWTNQCVFIDINFRFWVFQLLGFCFVDKGYGYHSAQVGVATDALEVTGETHHADKDVTCLTNSDNVVL